MLKLYSKDTTIFDNNGLGVLKDYITNPIITEALNGEYTLEFGYSKTGVLAEYLLEENLIKAKGKIFRISFITKKMTSIKILAKHIAFDLSKNMLIDVYPTEQDGIGAMNWILDHTQFNHNFTAWSDVTTINSARYIRKNVIEAIMSADNSIIQNWGGELEFDNYTIKLHAHRGEDRGLVIRYGKNLNGVEYQLDFSSVATRIIPVGNNELMLPEVYIDSTLIDNYTTPIIKTVSLNIGVDENTTEAQALELMRQEVNKLYQNGLDVPTISVSVDFVELSKTVEYQKYSNLESAYLGDTIKFIIPDLNLNLETRIVKTIYDCAKERYTKFELGTIVPNFVNQSSNEVQKIVKTLEVLPKNLLEQAQRNATEQLTSALGGYVYKTQNELFIMDTDNVLTAEKVWRWNLNGLGYSSTGIEGPYGLAMTQDGQIVADFITTGELAVERITGLANTLNSISIQLDSINGSVKQIGRQ